MPRVAPARRGDRSRLTVGFAVIPSGMVILFTGAQPGRGASITGTTLAREVDAPLNSVAVSVFSDEDEWQARSDDRGQFTIFGLPAGRYSLEAHRSGFKKVVVNNILLATDDSRTLIVSMGICNNDCDAGCGFDPVSYRAGDAGMQGRLLVTVISDGRPVASAGLILTAPGSTSALSRASTHENGHAEIGDVPPGRYVLSVSAKGYQSTAVSDVRLLARRATVVTVDLLRNGLIRVCQ
jgi:hypothetical protein